ncbi:hypothetical protein WA158_000802 [Blastocystis sp. Blastoise]
MDEYIDGFFPRYLRQWSLMGWGLLILLYIRFADVALYIYKDYPKIRKQKETLYIYNIEVTNSTNIQTDIPTDPFPLEKTSSSSSVPFSYLKRVDGSPIPKNMQVTSRDTYTMPQKLSTINYQIEQLPTFYEEHVVTVDTGDIEPYKPCDKCLLAITPIDYDSLPFVGVNDTVLYYVEFTPSYFPPCIKITKCPKWIFDENDMYIITGATSEQVHSSINLLDSIIKRRIDIPIIFIDFGIDIKGMSLIIETLLFLDRIRTDRGIYLPSFYRKLDLSKQSIFTKKNNQFDFQAIQAYIQLSILKETEGKGWWIDPSIEIKDLFFNHMNELNNRGIVSLGLPNKNIRKTISKKILNYFHIPYENTVLNKNSCSITIIGFNYKIPIIRDTIIPLYTSCLLNKTCYIPIYTNPVNTTSTPLLITPLLYHYNITNNCNTFNEPIDWLLTK